jgi:hypothetical protein
LQSHILIGVAKEFGFNNYMVIVWYKPNKFDGGGPRLITQTEYIIILHNHEDPEMAFSMVRDLEKQNVAACIRSNVVVLDKLHVRVFVHAIVIMSFQGIDWVFFAGVTAS